MCQWVIGSWSHFLILNVRNIVYDISNPEDEDARNALAGNVGPYNQQILSRMGMGWEWESGALKLNILDPGHQYWGFGVGLTIAPCK